VTHRRQHRRNTARRVFNFATCNPVNSSEVSAVGRSLAAGLAGDSSACLRSVLYS
jgi:hypothetical protein